MQGKRKQRSVSSAKKKFVADASDSGSRCRSRSAFPGVGEGRRIIGRNRGQSASVETETAKLTGDGFVNDSGEAVEGHK
jgi:hypothetical protein